MAIEETLQLNDEVSGPAEDAASALDDVGSAASDAQSALDEIEGASSGAADGAEEVASAFDEVGKSAGEAGQSGASAFSDIGEAATGLNQALEIGGKIAKVAGKVWDIAKAFGGAVIAAHEFREGATSALDQLTGGRGEAALASLESAARDLGISTESAVDQFKGLREAGASNADASALIKMRADLEAVGLSSEQAEKAVDATLKRIKKGEDAGDAIADVAKSFGAVGDGANAAAKRSLTFSGALANIQAIGGRVFGRIAEAAGPALDGIGAKITSVLDSFEDSGAMQSAIDGIAAALEYVPPIIDGILAAWDAFSASAEPGVTALSDAFGSLSDALGESGGGMSAASAVGSALGFVISTIANTVAGVVSTIAAFVGALSAMSGAASSAGEAVGDALSSIADIDLASAGADLIAGFIEGIMGAIGSVVSAAASVGDAAAGALKGALGIASPSKVALELAENFGGTFAETTEETIPAEIDAPSMTAVEIPAPEVAPANDVGASVMAGGGGGAPVVHVEINISGGAGGLSMVDIEAATRRGVIQALRESRAA